MARGRNMPGRTARERAMIVDYWRREWRGERDPLRGVAKKFKIPPKKAVMFFIDHNIDLMSKTKH